MATVSFSKDKVIHIDEANLLPKIITKTPKFIPYIKDFGKEKEDLLYCRPRG